MPLMWPYLTTFSLVAWLALTHRRPHSPTAGHGTGIAWPAVFLLLCLLIGLRHEVGGDWDSYILYVDSMQGESVDEVWSRSDPAFQLLCWIGANIGGGVYFVNLACAVIFSWGLLTFCRSQRRPWLALLVSMPYLVTVVAMGYTRQGVAIGLAMLAMKGLDKRQPFEFVAWIALAALFHKSAIILLPFVVASCPMNGRQIALGLITAGALFLALPIADFAESLAVGYLEAEYQSDGASIRIIAIAIPAAVLLVYRHRLHINACTRRFWTALAWSGLMFIPLLLVSPSSTAVDRFALYWLPLQVFVWSQAPEILPATQKGARFWLAAITLGSGLVLMTWLFFAHNAYAWLPYQFYPWVLFWR